MNAREIFKLGFSDLVSVVPPGAKLTENSKLDASQLGKVPGKRSASGEWYGYNWMRGDSATLRDVAQWDADGANIGMRARYAPAVDIDCTDPALVDVIRQLAFEILGHAPERQGRAPKSLLVYWTDEPFGRMRLWLDGRKHLVEILGDGQQYVIAGTHPATNAPYKWIRPLCRPDQLCVIDRHRAESFLTAVADAADMLGYTSEREGNGAVSVDREGVNQGAHVADPERVAAAVAVIPNDNQHFAGRDDYLRMGYAIKAAAGDAAYPVFEAWAMKWEGNENFDGNDAETVRADWDRMQPPYEVGANWLFDTAREFGYNGTADEFEAIDAPAAELQLVDPDTAGVAYSDAALASRFLRAHSHEVRYCPDLGGWMVWNGVKWERDVKQLVNHWAGQIGKTASAEALICIPEKGTAHKVATRCASLNSMIATARYASSNPAVFARVDQFDADTMLLNTPGGVVDLTTGEMRPHDSALMMTKATAYAPAKSAAPVWEKFLDDTTAGDKDLQAYLQRFAGYSLTGETYEHNLIFMYGGGGNGKGTFLNTLTKIWADYAKVSQMATFMASNRDAHPTALADLAGARLVQAQENDETRRWDEARIKSLTGGDPVTARFMREDFFTYQPHFKLLFAGNNRPTLTKLDDAMRRRFHMVPFLIKPKTPNNRLTAQLEQELPAILQWAIEGALEWQRIGLAPPAAVLAATAEYFEDQDALGQWLRENTTAAPGQFAQSHVLYTDWREFANEASEEAGSEKRFVQALQTRGFERKKQGGTGLRGFMGLRLKATPGSEFATV
jgi:P4 family phage/plasmid primase-like protien